MQRFSKNKTVYVQDPVYGLIEIVDLCIKFIDTPEFQRLKRIRQLGMTPEVFPSGTHSRFEHSLGVMHIAGVFFDYMMKNSEEKWQEFEQYKILVMLAGLLHDLGHGPFSHVFQEAMKIRNQAFCHEEHSGYLIDRINDRLNLLAEGEVDIIKHMIRGKRMDGLPPFLFQIVANKDSGLDVDKMDYLRRDAYHIGKTSISIDYIIKHTRVDRYGELSYSFKTAVDIRTLFANRKQMYETVYYHKTVKKIDKIMVCALCQLDIDFEDPDCFFKLDDYTVMHILRYEMQHDVVNCLNSREFEHGCEKCPGVQLVRVAKLSGDVDGDPLQYIRFYED